MRHILSALLALAVAACGRESGATARVAPTLTPVPKITAHAGNVQPAPAMHEPRAAHTATLLADGRVLIAGGFKDDGHGDELALASAELYDPATGAFTVTGSLTEPRIGHTATQLLNGSVLLVGGWGEEGRLSTTEFFDPASGTFARATSLATRRANHTATLLDDGRVLIAGGSQSRNTLQPIAELYDPASGAFTALGALGEPREGHTATRLPDGRVLLIGGTGQGDRVLTSAEVFDPATQTFTRTGDLGGPRRKHAAVLLGDGRVLVLGGSDERDWDGKYTSTALFDPATNTFAPGPRLNGERFKLADAAVLLRDGRVLVSGGHAQVELLDRERFIAGDSLDAAYYFSTATVLADGGVLIAGGYDRDIVATAQTWLFR